MPVVGRCGGALLAALVLASPAAAQRYTATRDGEFVVLADRQTDTVVKVVPSVGNMAVEMRVRGHNVLRYQHASLDDFRAQPGQTGIPFMGPWINRLDDQAFYANGRRHAFDMSLGNIRGEVPIHGFVTATNLWRVVSVEATVGEASMTSRLDFYRQPSWMRQWPYAHTVEMTYRLIDGVLEVATTITNLSDEPMPVAVGFHPYFQLTDSPRDEWSISVGAKTRWLFDSRKLPTGVTEPSRAAPAAAEGRPSRLQPRRSVRRPRPRRRGPRHDDALGPVAAARRRDRPALSIGGGVGAESVWEGARRAGRLAARRTQLHLLRTDGRHHQRAEHGPPRTVRRASDDRARRDLARELLGEAERLLTPPPSANRAPLANRVRVTLAGRYAGRIEGHDPWKRE